MRERIRNWPDLGPNPEAVTIGSLFVTLFAVQAWATAVARFGHPRLGSLATSNHLQVFVLPALLVYGVGIALAAGCYARIRNVEIPFGIPTRDDWPVAASAVLAGPLLVAAGAVVGDVVFGTTVSAMVQLRYSPDARLSFLVFSSFVPALLKGLGYGLLFFGVVHERLRETTTPRHALVLTPVVVGFFWEMQENVRHDLLDPIAVAHITVLAAVSVGFGASLGLLYRGTVRESVGRLVRVAYVPVFSVGLLGAVGVASGFDFPPVLLDVLRLGAFAVAAYGYERTRSIWVPILVVAVFLAAVDAAAFAESVAAFGGPI